MSDTEGGAAAAPKPVRADRKKFRTMQIDTRKVGVLGGGTMDAEGECYSPKSPSMSPTMYSPKLVVADPSKKERQLQRLVEPHTIADFYDFGAALGEGGFGCVREITHAKTFQPFAGKILRKDHLDQDIGGGMTDEAFRAISELLLNTEHQNLCSFVHLFEDDVNYFLVMPKADGGTLHDTLSDLRDELEGPLTTPVATEADVKGWMMQLFLGIGYLHGLRVVHRDIKPANALFLDAGKTQLVLADFDMCVKIPGDEPRLQKATDWKVEVIDGNGAVLGTGGYQAPEIINEAKYSKQTDLYALGAFMLHVIALRFPFDGEEEGSEEDYNFQMLWLKGFQAEIASSIKDDRAAGLEFEGDDAPASPASPASPAVKVPKTPLAQNCEFKSEYAAALPDSCIVCLTAARNYSVSMRETLASLLAINPQERPMSCQVTLQQAFFGMGKGGENSGREKKKKQRTARKSQHINLLNMKEDLAMAPDPDDD